MEAEVIGVPASLAAPAEVIAKDLATIRRRLEVNEDRTKTIEDFLEHSTYDAPQWQAVLGNIVAIAFVWIFPTVLCFPWAIVSFLFFERRARSGNNGEYDGDLHWVFFAWGGVFNVICVSYFLITHVASFGGVIGAIVFFGTWLLAHAIIASHFAFVHYSTGADAPVQMYYSHTRAGADALLNWRATKFALAFGIDAKDLSADTKMVLFWTVGILPGMVTGFIAYYLFRPLALTTVCSTEVPDHAMVRFCTDTSEVAPRVCCMDVEESRVNMWEFVAFLTGNVVAGYNAVKFLVLAAIAKDRNDREAEGIGFRRATTRQLAREASMTE